MIRRRDKRRHVTPNSIDLRDPYSVIALAIRFDESMGEESLLLVPLETGHIYNQKLFAKALVNLQKQTMPPRHGASSTRKKQEPVHPITPIILSGLLAAIEQEDEDAPTSTELVACCRSMRRAALARVRVRKQRQRIQRTITPVILVAGVVFLVFWSTSNVKALLIDFGFVDSCSTMACRLAEARLWEHINPPQILRDCTMEACPLMEGQEEYPIYAMHTMVQPGWISLGEIESKRTKQKGYWRPGDKSSPLQWLGETTVNRLVRDAIMTTLPASSTLKLLDVGCGIGGTLYSLLTSKTQQKRLSYHGIAISTPEIYQARRLITSHQLLESKMITFEQQDFDEPLDQTYSVMVAIESLSYSPELSVTLKNLASSLQSKSGILVLVDDVIAPWTTTHTVEKLRNVTARASLITHKEWKHNLVSSGFVIKEVRDLGLEMDLPELTSGGPKPNLWRLLGDWRHSTAQIVLKRWSKWYGEGASVEQKASLRTVQLVQDLVQKARATALRQEAYRDADLSYYMYICVKQ
jgi:SAM-dependent methyltransferase